MFCYSSLPKGRLPWTFIRIQCIPGHIIILHPFGSVLGTATTTSKATPACVPEKAFLLVSVALNSLSAYWPSNCACCQPIVVSFASCHAALAIRAVGVAAHVPEARFPRGASCSQSARSRTALSFSSAKSGKGGVGGGCCCVVIGVVVVVVVAMKVSCTPSDRCHHLLLAHKLHKYILCVPL